MADTLDNVILSENQWTDLYAATGIAAGTKLSVQNLTSSHVRLYSAASSPTPGTTYGFNTLPPFMVAINESGDTGAWAFSSSGGAVNVKEVAS